MGEDVGSHVVSPKGFVLACKYTLQDQVRETLSGESLPARGSVVRWKIRRADDRGPFTARSLHLVARFDLQCFDGLTHRCCRRGAEPGAEGAGLRMQADAGDPG